MRLVHGEILDENKTELFYFSLDMFNDDEKWSVAVNHFERTSEPTGSRVWSFRGTFAQFKLELQKFKLESTGGYRSDPKWNDGNWIFVSLKILD